MGIKKGIKPSCNSGTRGKSNTKTPRPPKRGGGENGRGNITKKPVPHL